MQQNFLSLVSSSDVPQMIQLVHSLFAAEWNPGYRPTLSYFVITITIHIYIVSAFLI